MSSSTGRTRLALTIDDLPWHEPVSRDRLRSELHVLSSALVAAGIPATGFVNGGRSHLAEMQVWLDAGLGLGNHTYSHIGLSNTSSDAFVEDIARNERIVLDTLGHDLRGGWFRYPYLDHGDPAKRAAVARYLKANRYTLAPVSLNTCDYAFAKHEGASQPSKWFGERYLEHVLDCVQHFARLSRHLYEHNLPLILLLHANELNARCIFRLATRLHEEGCEFVALTDALSDPVYRAFATTPPATTSPDSRGDFLGDVARSRGVSVEPDPSRAELFEARTAGMLGR